MSHHTATIVWQRDAQAFTDHRYSRRHSWHFDGGAEVAASSSPHVVRLPFSDPSAVDPEEAFIAALSSCHMLWFLDLAARAGWVVDSYRDAAIGLMARNGQGRMAMAQVTLHPAVQFGGDNQPSHEAVQQLHHAAHAECYIANSVTTEVLCEPVF